MDVIKHLAKTFKEKDIFKQIIGQEDVKYQITSAISMGRSIILVGPPGCGKTTFAKCIADALPDFEKEGEKVEGHERFVRVQGSPDLTAEDLLGDIDPIKALEFGPLSTEAFTPGKIFKADQGVFFFDEVNRCPQKIQNSLLQVLQEKFATIGSYDIDFPANFIFIGTMNPEDSSTEKLSTVFMDRFDMVYVDYPGKIEDEVEIILENGEKFEIEDIKFPKDILQNMILFIRQLRQSDKLSRVPSVRATLGLYERAQSNAYLNNRKTIIAKDVMDSVVSVLSHRIELKPSVKYLQTPEEFIQEEFKTFAGTRGMETESDEDGDSG